MPTAKPRMMLTLNEDFHDLLGSLSQQTGMSMSAIVNKLLGAHVHELYEYDSWLKQAAKTALGARGRFLMHNYGPDTLMEAIRAIDPHHEFESEAFERQLGPAAARRTTARTKRVRQTKS